MKYKTIAAEFQAYDQRRIAKLERVREASSLTIPGLMPDLGVTNEIDLPVPYTSIGAKGVASLASRLVSNIFPLNDQPFYGFDVSKFEDTPQIQQNPEMMLAIKQKLSNIERRILNRFASSNYRSALFVVCQHLIVVGDCLLQINDQGLFQVHRLDQYVVRRRPDGKICIIILREWVDPELLPEELQNVKKGNSVPLSGSVQGLEPHFTKLEYKDGMDYDDETDDTDEKWTVTKEFRGTIHESGKTYKVNPYMALRWSEMVGEDYGRSLCEENAGDLRSAESLAKSLIEGAAAMAEFRIGVDPTGITKVEDLTNSENGAYVPAKQTDVFSIHAELREQVQATMEALMAKEKALGRTFLMDSAIQPQGDRVTAYQVNVLTNELQSVLNAPLTALYRDIQLPSVLRMIEIMRQANELPVDFDKILDQKLITIRVRTGLEALSKEIQSAKLTSLAELVLRLPEEGQKVVDWAGFVRSLWINAGADPLGVVYTEEQMAQKQQDQQNQAMQAAAAQQGIQSAGAIAEQQAAQQSAVTQPPGIQ